MDHRSDPGKYFNLIHSLEDDSIDLAYAALGLAVMANKSMDYYVKHLQSLSNDTAEHYRNLITPSRTFKTTTFNINKNNDSKIDSNDDKNTDISHDVGKQLYCLQSIIFDQYNYQGNSERYDDLENADLCAVIERRKGMPIALSIICIHVAKALGWDAVGIAMPGHFVCRLEAGGERIVFDPFNGGKELNAVDLRQLLKQSQGPDAELKPEYFEPISNRAILLRLQNNIKTRQIEQRLFTDALLTLEKMRSIAPDEAAFLLESGQLYAHTNQPQAAINMLTLYLETAPQNYDRNHANQLLQKLKRQLN